MSERGSAVGRGLDRIGRKARPLRRGRGVRWTDIPRPTMSLNPKDTVFTRVNFSNTYQLAAATTSEPAAAAELYFPVNGAWRPNITIDTGLQPYVWDQWTSLYNTFLVIKSHIKCTFVSNSDTAVDSLVYVYVLHRNQTLVNNRDVLTMADAVQTAYIDAAGASPYNNATIDCGWNIMGEEGGSVGYMDFAGTAWCGSTATANPTSVAQYVIGQVPWANGNLTTTVMQVRVDITYDVLFFDPVFLLTS